MTSLSLEIKERAKNTDKYGGSGWNWSNTCSPSGEKGKQEGKKEK
jgi:hypothetical protein